MNLAHFGLVDSYKKVCTAKFPLAKSGSDSESDPVQTGAKQDPEIRCLNPDLNPNIFSGKIPFWHRVAEPYLNPNIFSSNIPLWHWVPKPYLNRNTFSSKIRH